MHTEYRCVTGRRKATLPAFEYVRISATFESKVASCSIYAPGKIKDATSSVVFCYLISPRYRCISYLCGNSSTNSAEIIKALHCAAGEIDN